jgi:mannan endo-1,4-beta-mannosidase
MLCRSAQKSFNFLLALLLPLGAATTHALVDPQATPETQALYSKIVELTNRNAVAFGNEYSMFRGLYRSGSGWSNTDLSKPFASDIKNMSGLYPTVCGWDFHEFAENANSWRQQNIDAIILSAELGVINTMSFHMRNPKNQSNYDDTDLDIVDVMPGGAYHDVFRGYWQAAADAIKLMQMENGSLVPIIIRPYHELSGNWFWWGTRNTTPEQFVALWRWTVEFLRDENDLHNLLYCYSTDKVYSVDSYLQRWPGDDYVDIVGIDIYLTDPSPFAQDPHIGLTFPLQICIDVARMKGMPAAFTETGYPGGMGGTELENWWTYRILEPLKAKGLLNDIAYVMGWANWGTHQWNIPYPGSWLEPDFIEFLRSPEILLLDDFDPDSVWTWHPGPGWIYTVHYPWVYHMDHGWWYMPHLFNDFGRKFLGGKLINSFWFYDLAAGWLWTSDSIYPDLYVPSHGWLQFISSSATERWFYRYSQADYIQLPRN